MPKPYRPDAKDSVMNGKNHVLAEPAAAVGVDQLVQNGLQFHQQGAFDKAARLYEKVLKKEPGNLAALNFLADARLREGKPARAVQTAQKALKLKADMPGTLFILGNALGAMGRHLEAARQLEEAIRLKPDYTDAYLSLGNAYRELGDGPKSLAILIPILPKHALISPMPTGARNCWKRPQKNTKKHCASILAWPSRIAISLAHSPNSTGRNKHWITRKRPSRSIPL